METNAYSTNGMGQQQTPTFYVGNLPDIQTPQDTYLKISAKQWTKVSRGSLHICMFYFSYA